MRPAVKSSPRMPEGSPCRDLLFLRLTAQCGKDARIARHRLAAPKPRNYPTQPFTESTRRGMEVQSSYACPRVLLPPSGGDCFRNIFVWLPIVSCWRRTRPGSWRSPFDPLQCIDFAHCRRSPAVKRPFIYDVHPRPICCAGLNPCSVPHFRRRDLHHHRLDNRRPCGARYPYPPRCADHATPDRTRPRPTADTLLQVRSGV